MREREATELADRARYDIAECSNQGGRTKSVDCGAITVSNHLISPGGDRTLIMLCTLGWTGDLSQHYVTIIIIIKILCEVSQQF